MELHASLPVTIGWLEVGVVVIVVGVVVLAVIVVSGVCVVTVVVGGATDGVMENNIQAFSTK